MPAPRTLPRPQSWGFQSWGFPSWELLSWALLALLVTAAATGPLAAQPGTAAGLPQLFVTADRCMVCHDGLTSDAGEDVSIGTAWRPSMMANAARDPYWQAAVRREVTDHPEAAAAIQHECAACHMPMARFRAEAAGGQGAVFPHLPGSGVATAETALALDGVSCSMCHQIEAAGLGEPESFTAGFDVDTTTAGDRRRIFGPFEMDPGRTTIMRSAAGFEPVSTDHIRGSELCATCHTLYTHALGAGGETVGELPEQMPYLEWRHSAYRDERSCQSCHMPVVDGEAPASSVWGEPRREVSRHLFRGANFFMPLILDRYRDELGVVATSAELAAMSTATERHLASSSAHLAVSAATLPDGHLKVTVEVTNLAGHKLPSAYPSRRAWLHLTVRDADGTTVFESGAVGADGAIAGNDNDADPARFEPHHDRITSPDQVQIYEAILGGPDGAVTTGLLTAVEYLKDNRLLPDGFDKATAPHDVAVAGAALADDSFRGGGDRVVYLIEAGDAAGPFSVAAELRYQPISFRWARNLEPYAAAETRRFGRYFEALAEVSHRRLASAETSLGSAGRTAPVGP